MFGLILIVVLDVAALWGITSFLAQRDMSEDALRFVLFIGLLILVGFGISGLPALLALAVWFALLLLGMKFWFGATWVGALVGACLFVAYRFALLLVLALLLG